MGLEKAVNNSNRILLLKLVSSPGKDKKKKKKNKKGTIIEIFNNLTCYK